MHIKNKQLAIRRVRDLRLIASAVFFLYSGFGIYLATFNNFAVGVIHMQPEQLGVLEALREFPGLAMAFVLAIAMHIAEPLLGCAALMLLSAGFAGYSQTENYAPIVFYSVVWSVGLHVWMPLQSAMTLALFDEHEKGKRLGQMGAYAGLGTSVGIVLVLIFTKSVSFSTWYMTASALVMVSAIMVLFIRRDLTPPDKPRMVLKRKYGLYYALTFLEGCRKQVFITFAVYAMVREYDASLKAVAMLMLINNVTNLLAAPVVGRLIDRIGEKRVLMTSYAALIFVFLGYALIQDLPVLYVLYCLDSLLYLSTYGLTTYLNRIADSRDLVPSLSMGVTMNHVAAVAVPLVGGFLWGALGYQAAFIGGAVVVVISLNLVRRMIIKPEPQCSQ